MPNYLYCIKVLFRNFSRAHISTLNEFSYSIFSHIYIYLIITPPPIHLPHPTLNATKYKVFSRCEQISVCEWRANTRIVFYFIHKCSFTHRMSLWVGCIYAGGLNSHTTIMCSALHYLFDADMAHARVHLLSILCLCF